MQKRTFLKTLGKAGAAYLAMPLLQACAGRQEKGKIAADGTIVSGLPNNWMWLRPDLGLSDEAWKSQFGRMRAAGIEAVLPQIFDGVFAYFDHPNYPVKEPLLERLIPLAHAEGLQIHAWMWCMPSNHPDILENHPDWYAVNGKGEPANLKPAYVDYYKFLCPCHPEVRHFVQERVSVLANIAELDGIHLDYIRVPDVILAEGLQPKYNIVQDKEYPEYDYSYSTYCRERFKAQTGIDPLTDLKAPAENGAWRQFRYNAVNDLVNAFLVPAAKKGNKTITAAVFPNWESVRQQWHQWNLDAFLPMLYHGFYNAPVDWIGQQVGAALERLNSSKPVFSGLFVPHLSPEELERSIDVSLAAGAKGISLFSYKDMSDAHWAALGRKLAE